MTFNVTLALANKKVSASNNDEERINLIGEFDAHLRQAESAREPSKKDQYLLKKLYNEL